MENWKPIAGYEGIYEVSDLGQIKRIKPEHNTHVGKILAGGLDQDGYRLILLYDSGKRRMFKAHRIVATAFVPNPDNLPQINHKNAVKADNRADNLEWCSCKYNINHAVDSGLWNAAKGSRHRMAKLTESDVLAIRTMKRSGISTRDLAARFSVSRATIGDLLAGRTWSWLV